VGSVQKPRRFQRRRNRKRTIRSGFARGDGRGTRLGLAASVLRKRQYFQEGFEHDEQALVIAQRRVRGGGEDVHSGAVPFGDAGQQFFMEAVGAFERIDEREARMKINHERDLSERAHALEERDKLLNELSDRDGEIQRHRSGADAAYRSADDARF
jgi:hypothetical protein